MLRLSAAGLLGLAVVAAAAAQVQGPAYEQEPFGVMPERKGKDGKTVRDTVTAYTLVNKNGVRAKVINYGAILTELKVPDKNGKLADVVLGFDNLKSYLDGHPFFGANAGRVANRVGNAKFKLDGKEYTLAANNGPHSLHGGKEGFDKKVWKAEPMLTGAGPAVKFSYTSPDGEEGYPGTLAATVTYTLTDRNEFRVDFVATTDKPTVCNLAHHSYFNLAGHNAGDILGHEAQLFASKYTPADDTLLPTGKIEPVKGTPFDFTAATPIGKRIKEINAKPVGYDTNFVLDGQKAEEGLTLAARVTDPKSGRVMDVLTTEPGVQFYTGNFLDGKNVGKGGAVYNQYAGFCLEAQKFPDAINKPEWPSPILRPGETYRQTTIYRFSAK